MCKCVCPKDQCKCANGKTICVICICMCGWIICSFPVTLICTGWCMSAGGDEGELRTGGADWDRDEHSF